MSPSIIKKDQNEQDSFYNHPQQSREQKKIDNSHKLQSSKSKHQSKLKQELNLKAEKKQKSLEKKRMSERKKNDKKEILKKAEQQANQMIQLVTNSYEEDVKLFQAGKIANKKLLCLQKIAKKLKDVYIAEKFLKLGGIILFDRWLIANEETGQQSSLTVKLNLMRLLSELDVNFVQIEDAQSLKKTILKYKKSKFADLRKLSEEIIQKWNLAKLKKQ